MNTKQIGNIGLAHAILYFTKQAYTVLLPINDSQKYDLAVDINSVIYSVEVKTTRQISPSNQPVVCLRSMGGSSKSTYHTVIESHTDYLYVYHTELDKAWFIPIIDINQVSTINLSSSYDKYVVA